MSVASVKVGVDPYASRYDGAGEMRLRADPVVYAPAGPRAPIPAAECERYDRDGFLVFDDLFDDAELQALKRELERLKASVSDLRVHGVVAEPGGSSLRSIFRVHQHSALFRRLALDGRLVRRAEHLLGSQVYIHQSRLNYKPGFNGKEFYWHSDFETWHVEDGMPRMRAVSFSISLSENTEFNGPLMLVPGSHRFYVSCAGKTPENHYKQSLRQQEYGVPDSELLTELVRRGGIATVTGPPGTAVCFDCNTMHGSNGNISPLPRSNVFIVYNSIDNVVQAPFGAVKPRPEFLSERTSFEPVHPIDGTLSAGIDDAS